MAITKKEYFSSRTAKTIGMISYNMFQKVKGHFVSILQIRTYSSLPVLLWQFMSDNINYEK